MGWLGQGENVLGTATLRMFEWYKQPPELHLSRHQVALRAQAQMVLARAETEIRRILERAGLVALAKLDGSRKWPTRHPSFQRRPRSLGKQSVLVSFYMPVDQAVAVEHMAAKLNVSRSQVLRGAIRHGLGKYERSENVTGRLPEEVEGGNTEPVAAPVRPRITGA